MKLILKECNFELVYKDLLWEMGNISLFRDEKIVDEQVEYYKKHCRLIHGDQLEK